jgi:hypothetical protein
MICANLDEKLKALLHIIFYNDKGELLRYKIRRHCKLCFTMGKGGNLDANLTLLF